MRSFAVMTVLLVCSVATSHAAVVEADTVVPAPQLPSIVDVDRRALMILLGLSVIGLQLRRKYRSSEHPWQRIAPAERAAAVRVGRPEPDFAAPDRASTAARERTGADASMDPGAGRGEEHGPGSASVGRACHRTGRAKRGSPAASGSGSVADPESPARTRARRSAAADVPDRQLSA